MGAIRLQDLTSYKLKESLEKKETAAKEEGHKTREDSGDFSAKYAMDCLADDEAGVGAYLDAFSSGKFMGENVSIKEVLTSQDFPELFYSATEILMMNRILPQRVISENLFTTIPYDGKSMSVTIRSLGGVKVEEIAEGGLYPETSSAVNDQAYRIHLEVKKYGAKIAATKELMESDNWGILAYTLANLADELVNKREKLCMQAINEQAGYTLIDNNNAAGTPLGSCTGRGLDGAQNGALGIDDIMNALSYMQMRGSNIDTIIIHPFAWSMWVRDPEIREVVLNSNVIYTPQGAPAPGWGQSPFGQLGVPYNMFGSGIAALPPAQGGNGQNQNVVDPLFGKLGIAPYAYPTLTPFGSTFYVQPKFIDKPLKVIVSPLVPYYKVNDSSSPANGKFATNIILADSMNCGIILQKENPSMDEWDDIEREVHFLKVKESYGLAMKDQGRHVAVLRNIVIDRTYAFENMHSVTLPNLSTTKNLV